MSAGFGLASSSVRWTCGQRWAHQPLLLQESTRPLDYLGGTIDDAAGEAFDKVAAMLQLDFPGTSGILTGRQGNRQAYSFPFSDP